MRRLLSVPLTQGKRALVDGCDATRIGKHKWYAYTDGYNWYAARMAKKLDGKRRILRMHSEIMQPKAGHFTDHVNGNGLDNRRENLRIVTHQQNCMNRHRRKDNSSGSKGVHYDATHRKYVARIQVSGRRFSLGYFWSKKDAAAAYAKAALKTHKQYARNV